jgi:hypothetical protein
MFALEEYVSSSPAMLVVYEGTETLFPICGAFSLCNSRIIDLNGKSFQELSNTNQ